MKITKNKNFACFCILFLLAFSNNISNITSAHVTMRNKYQNRGKALSRTKGVFAFLKNLLKGLGAGVFGATSALQDNFLKMLGCFKKKSATLVNAPADGAMNTTYSAVDKGIGMLAEGIKKIFSVISASTLGLICKARKTVIIYIAKFWNWIKLRKYRRMIESGKTLTLKQLRKYRLSWGFGGILNSAVSLYKSTKNLGKKIGSIAYKKISNFSNKAFNWILNTLKPFIMKHWATIKSVITAIKGVFLGPDSFLVKLVECSKTVASNVWNAIKDFWKDLKEKYERYVKIYSLPPFYIALYGIDILSAVICNDDLAADLQAKAAKIETAQKSNDHNTEVQTGAAIVGKIMKFQTEYKSTISSDITDALKSMADGNKPRPVIQRRFMK